MSQEKQHTESNRERITNKYAASIEQICDVVIEIALDRKVAAQIRLKAAQMVMEHLSADGGNKQSEHEQDEILERLTDGELEQIEAILRRSFMRRGNDR
jgi:uncharacterized protein (UPF0147 family)